MRYKVVFIAAIIGVTICEFYYCLGVEITSEIAFSQFCCLNEDFPDLGIRDQNIAKFASI
jgi:hypothetical protein